MSEGTERATPLRVAVVGGGYAGLAAAERLVARGAVPTVFERSGRLGGLAMTLSVGGDEIEKYYHHWFTSDRDVLGLVHDLDLADRLRWISPVMGIFCRGEIHRFTSPIDLLRFKPFSWRAKLRFGAVTLFLQRYPRRQTFEGVSAASWLRRVAGREVYETVWGPLLRAKFGRRAPDVSMAWIWSKMRLRGRSRTQDGTEEALGYLEGGFGVLTRRLAAEIERRGGFVRTTERVERISPRPGGGFDVRTPRGVEHFDAVISTVAPPILARLAPDLPADYRGRLEAIDHFAILCTLLVLRERISPIYWMNVSDPEVPFGGLIEHTNFVSPKRYGGRHLAYVSHYVDPEDDVWKLDLDGLLLRYLPGLRRIRSATATPSRSSRRTTIGASCRSRARFAASTSRRWRRSIRRIAARTTRCGSAAPRPTACSVTTKAAPCLRPSFVRPPSGVRPRAPITDDVAPTPDHTRRRGRSAGGDRGHRARASLRRARGAPWRRAFDPDG
jgi:protoporphyrinogen oxidase